jgi:hypothetical protein
MGICKLMRKLDGIQRLFLEAPNIPIVTLIGNLSATLADRVVALSEQVLVLVADGAGGVVWPIYTSTRQYEVAIFNDAPPPTSEIPLGVNRVHIAAYSYL